MYSPYIELWDPREDELLQSLVASHGTQTWTEIAKQLPNRLVIPYMYLRYHTFEHATSDFW